MGMNQCCFCWTFKNGAIILGCIGASFGSLATFAMTFLTFVENENQKYYPKENYPIALSLMVFYIACHISLIYGAVKVFFSKAD